MGRSLFSHADFLAAARALAAENGPAAVTVDAIAARLKAPKGSFYHRFASRDALLGELWLATVLAYQEGFVQTIEAGDGLAAALHTPAWVRANLDDARLLLLYSRHDFVQGEWPAALRRGVREQTERFEACLETFARDAFGRAGTSQIRRATFVLAEVPTAAVKQHLQRREVPPPLVDELIATTYRAIVGPGKARS
ncbi:transcriptional regulator, TetR family [Enhydrobacter aerosaccus]|uniref:Transcriptional regulator, TetR family n=1 Tax=Enhydrobacter aerosaccus TaxID=225324 RepID=A0A1T4SQL0_9HYPH|nr:TetR/AcrR family transcriptional regulator [Enhydrobacter aerosaccus]SKA30554.1 transcriptional regulator, TetR family [Enhydrobacter aerosaccus]